MRTKPSSSTCWTMNPSSSMCAQSMTVGAAVAPAAGEVVISERVGLVLVVMSVELGGDDVGDQALVPGDADGGVESGEQVEHPV